MMIPEVFPASLGMPSIGAEPVAAAASAEGNTADRSASGHGEAEKSALPLLFPLQASHLWFLNTLPPPDARKAPVRKPPPNPE